MSMWNYFRFFYVLGFVLIFSFSQAQDLDGDLVPDVSDIDIDNDGILNADEGKGSAVFVTTPEAFWTFENNTNDVSGNGYNQGSGTTAPTYSSTSVEGSFSAVFNGTSQEIRYSIDNTFMEAASSNISFSAWIQPTDVSGNRIIYEEGGTTHGSCLWINNGTLTYSIRNTSNQVNVTHPTALTVDNQWHHVAATFNNNGDISVFLDGVSNTINSGYTVIPEHTGDGYVGGSEGASSAGIDGNFAGLMDAVRYHSTSTWIAADILAESIRSVPDTDNDGISNDRDLDSDNDGIPDIIEAGGVDANNDGMVDSNLDTDNDGYANTFDSDNGGTALPISDTDGDGLENYLDIDSDGDGIIDNIEAQVSSGSPNQPSGTDSDSDGIDDSFDGVNNFLIPINTDGVGLPDYLDTDSDEDGFSDLIEAYDTDNDGSANTSPANSDTDNDGLDDNFDAVVGPNASTNPSNNGQTSNAFTNIDQTASAERDWREKLDYDGDGIGDGLDEDIDNDGVRNIIEGGGNAIFVTTPVAFWGFDNNTNDISGNGNNQNNSGTTAPNYSTDKVQGTASANFNGSSHIVRYSFDGGFMETQLSKSSYSAWIKPSNLTGTIPIIEEGGTTHGLILWLNNGVPTFSTRNSSAQINVVHPTTLTLDNQWHHVAATFNDGDITIYLDGVASNTVVTGYTVIPNHGSDGFVGGTNDNAAAISGSYSGLIDAVRYSNTQAWSSADIIAEFAFESSDKDNDGLDNAYDLDSDNDGISDLLEAGGTDSNNDGLVDSGIDTDQDGLVNTYDPDNGGTFLSDPDNDGDGLNNRVDIDSDGDGIVDVIEAQLTTASPKLPSGTDSDNDGIDDSFDGSNSLLTPVNTDGTDTPDYIDTDSDNDVFTDALEAYDTDNDGTANTVASGADADEDGLDDNFDNVNGINSGTNVSNGGQTSISFPNLDNTVTAQRDWREKLDYDGDGVPDPLDIDVDNDGILNNLEVEATFVTSPEAFWSFDGNTNDISGNNHNQNTGTVAPTYSTDAVQGSNSASFNGSTHLIRYSQDGGFMETAISNASYSAWIKPTSVTGQRMIIDEGGATNGLALWLNGNVVTFSVRDNNNQVAAAAASTISTNQWYHVAGTYDNSGNVSVYLNGVRSNVVAGYTSITEHAGNGYLGGTDGQNAAGVSGFFEGLIDAARYDNDAAWTPAQILQEAILNSDQDNDGITNDFDLDSDGDGIPDIIEAGGVDSDNDGRVDDNTDTDGDGYANLFDSDNGGTALALPNTDANPIRDFLDIDSDNDGITDNVEGQTTATFTAPSGSDTDGDGWDDAYDPDNGGSLTISNIDGDPNPDYIDSDSDNDGEPDYAEAFDDNSNGESFDDFRTRGNQFESRASNIGYYNYIDINSDSIVDWAQDLDSNGTAELFQIGSAYFYDSDFDGLIDLFDTDNFGDPYTGADNDLNGIPNFRDNGQAIPLPVSLVKFEAFLNDGDDTVNLLWITSAEINNDYFTVERAKEDGEFEEVAIVDGKGTTNVQQIYEAKDDEKVTGLFYYRLSQTDYDGKTKTYPAVQVFREAKDFSINEVELYPNPLVGLEVNLKVPKSNNDEINFFVNDLMGREFVSDVTIINMNDFNVIIIKFEQKPPKGVYLINLIVNKEIVTKKLLVR